MAKAPKSKNKAPSKHSRAARRAASPSLDIDKSLSDLKPPTKSSNSHIFRPQDSGIRKKKSKPPKRGQRLRQQKGLERAEMVMDQMELKIQKSVGKFHTIKERRKDWENVNSKIEAGGMFGALLDLRDDVKASDKSNQDSSKAMSGNKENKDVGIEEKLIAEDSGPLQLAFRPPPSVMGSRTAQQTIEDDADNVE